MANRHTDLAWQKLLDIDDPSDPLNPSPAKLRTLIATARVSDGAPGKEWVLTGRLKDGRFISCRATQAGIHAMTISTTRAHADSDLQRFKVATRVGRPRGNPKPIARVKVL